MNDGKLKKFLGKTIKASYLVWGDLGWCEGVLERINKESVLVNGKKVEKGAFQIEEVMEKGKWIKVGD